MFEKGAGEKVRASCFRGVESGKKSSCVAGAEKEKGGSLRWGVRVVGGVSVFRYGGECEF